MLETSEQSTKLRCASAIGRGLTPSRATRRETWEGTREDENGREGKRGVETGATHRLASISNEFFVFTFLHKAVFWQEARKLGKSARAEGEVWNQSKRKRAAGHCS